MMFSILCNFPGSVSSSIMKRHWLLFRLSFGTAKLGRIIIIVIFLLFKASVQKHNEDTVYHTLKDEIYRKPFYTELEFKQKLFIRQLLLLGMFWF